MSTRAAPVAVVNRLFPQGASDARLNIATLACGHTAVDVSGKAALRCARCVKASARAAKIEARERAKAPWFEFDRADPLAILNLMGDAPGAEDPST
jgi:hypothetical protein